MESLFPSIKPARSGQGVYHVISREPQHYRGLGDVNERIIPADLGMEYFGSGDGLELDIYVKCEEIMMTVALPYNYELGAVDDLASKLGERENPQIVCAQLIDSQATRRYGLPQVPHMATTRKTYRRAKDLINALTRHERADLAVLRRDSIEHENIAVRQMSRDYYHKMLDYMISK